MSSSAYAARVYHDKDTQVLRISASDVAAIAGYNEWTDIRELFLERMLYQDLNHVLRLDAENLGIEVEDRRHRVERLLTKTGDKNLRAVRVRAGDGVAVATVQDAQALRKKAKSMLKKAEGAKKLSKEEVKELGKELEYDINTKFGTRNEEVALKVYERRTGTEVLFNNDRKLVWPFHGPRVGEGVPDGAVKPPVRLSQGWTSRPWRSLKRPRAEAPIPARQWMPRGFASDPEDAEFISAVTRCLAQLPVRATLEEIIDQVVVSCADEGVVIMEARVEMSDCPAVCCLGATCGGDLDDAVRTVAGSATVGRGACQVVEGGPCIRGRRMGVGFASSAEIECCSEGQRRAVATVRGGRETVTKRKICRDDSVGAGPHGGSAMGTATLPSARPLGCCKCKKVVDSVLVKQAGELVQGVPWPEWRKSSGPIIISESTTPSPSTTPVAQVAAAAVDPTVPGAHAEAIAGLWFPACLTARQRAMVHQVARDQGLRHNSIGKSERRQVVVWNCHPPTVAQPSQQPSFPARTAAAAACSSDQQRLPNPLPYARPTAESTAVGGAGASDNCRAEEYQSPTAAMDKETTGATVGSLAPAGPGVSTGEPAAAAEEAVKRIDLTGEPTAAAAAKAGKSIDPMEAVAEGEVLVVPGWRSANEFAGNNYSKSSRSNRNSSSSRSNSNSSSSRSNRNSSSSSRSNSNSSSSRSNRNSSSSSSSRVCFVVVGAVDGVAEEITAAPHDSDNWEFRRVVVEIKNRMRRARDPPPLYDQIQLVTYMLMIGATAGDLVQFVKTRSDGRRDSKEPDAAPPDVTISRVELDCKVYNHRQHWHASVLPRLYEFARMVYKFRSNDDLRWRYLLASPEEQRAILVDCCPYLDIVMPRTSPQPSAISAAGNSSSTN